MLLTVKQIECAKHIEGQRRTKLSDGNKLFVYITDKSYKSFVVEYSFEGKSQSISLGSCSDLTLKEARLKALDIRVIDCQPFFVHKDAHFLSKSFMALIH